MLTSYQGWDVRPAANSLILGRTVASSEVMGGAEMDNGRSSVL
jgi:hypothetical protein